VIGIYKIISPTKRVYIGQSRNIEKRFITYNSLRCKQQPKLYNSFLKYGVKNHLFEIIEECNIELLNERERYYQDFYNVLENGLNCSLINSKDNVYVFSEDAIQKMKNWKRPFGENHHYYGKKRPEHSRKMSGENHPCWGKQNALVSEWNRKSKIGNKNMLGKKHSDKVKQILREKNEGVNHPMYGKKHKIETIKKMKLNHPKTNLGKKHTDESKLKMSLAGKGKKQTAEHILKRTANQKNNKHNSKIVIDIINGIFYNDAKDVLQHSQINISYSYFVSKLNGRNINDTNFKYA
jgi:group I intron endonuclease